MRFKSLFIVVFFLSSVILSAQTKEVKGLITFKTIKKDSKKNDTIVTNGKYTMVTLFNKKDSRLITISDEFGYYYFLLDKETAPYTHVQFYNDYGVYEVFPIKELKQPFHDVELVNYVGFKTIEPVTIDPIKKETKKENKKETTKITVKEKIPVTPSQPIEKKEIQENDKPIKANQPIEEIKEDAVKTVEEKEDAVDEEDALLLKEIKELQEALEREKEDDTVKDE